MKLTLREAADSVGCNKSTVFRAIQDGKLVAERSENGLIFIETQELLKAFPPESADNRLKVARRGRPIGSRKRLADGSVPETPQVALLSQQIVTLEKTNTELQTELNNIKNRSGADTMRLQDVTLERERLLARISILERNLDEVRAESAAKDGRLYEVKAEKDKLNARIEKLENALSELAATSKEPAKKSLIEKLFA